MTVRLKRHLDNLKRLEKSRVLLHLLEVSPFRVLVPGPCGTLIFLHLRISIVTPEWQLQEAWGTSGPLALALWGRPRLRRCEQNWHALQSRWAFKRFTFGSQFTTREFQMVLNLAECIFFPSCVPPSKTQWLHRVRKTKSNNCLRAEINLMRTKGVHWKDYRSRPLILCIFHSNSFLWRQQQNHSLEEQHQLPAYL